MKIIRISKLLSHCKNRCHCEAFFADTCADTPDWANCMNNKLCRQFISASNFDFSYFTTMQRYTLIIQLFARCFMNGSIHTAAAKQGTVSCIDNYVNGKFGDFSFDCGDSCHRILKYAIGLTINYTESRHVANPLYNKLIKGGYAENLQDYS